MRPTPRFLNRTNSTIPSHNLKKNPKPTIGIEPMTSSLPRKCSTTELRGHKKAHSSNPAKRWSGKRDSNPRPSAWKADALANWAIPASSTNLKIQDGEGRIRTSEGWADRFTVCSLWPLGNLPTLYGGRPQINPPPPDGNTWRTTAREGAPTTKGFPSNMPILVELAKGLEPPTCWLQISCSTNWATPAQQIKNPPYYTLTSKASI